MLQFSKICFKNLFDLDNTFKKMFVLVLLKLSDKCKQIIHKPLCFKTHIETAFILGLYVSQVPNFIIVFKSLAGQQWIEQQ